MALDDDMQTFRTKVRTNGDRIRAMDDAELAAFLAEDEFCGKITGEIATVSACFGIQCRECALNWLRKEAEP